MPMDEGQSDTSALEKNTVGNVSIKQHRGTFPTFSTQVLPVAGGGFIAPSKAALCLKSVKNVH